jgi:hypothetical protein
MIQITLSGPVLKLSWNIEWLESFGFALVRRKKSAGGITSE